MEQIPKGLFDGIEDDPEEQDLRAARYRVLDEMGFFGEKTNVSLCFTPEKGTWLAAVRKRFSGVYGDVAGCHPADIEVAAEMLDVFDIVFNAEVSHDRAA